MKIQKIGMIVTVLSGLLVSPHLLEAETKTERMARCQEEYNDAVEICDEDFSSSAQTTYDREVYQRCFRDAHSDYMTCTGFNKTGISTRN